MSVNQPKELQMFLFEKGYLAIPILQNAAGLLLIHVTINGVQGLFILDTGAGETVITTGKADHLKLVLQEDSTTQTGAGAGGLGLEVTLSNGNHVEIGQYIVMDFTICVMSLDHVNQAFAQAGIEEEFFGVIGVDILKPGKAVIDYGEMTLYLLQESQ
jgi:predicted aspartyl protease